MQVYNWLQFAVVAGLFIVLTPRSAPTWSASTAASAHPANGSSGRSDDPPPVRHRRVARAAVDDLRVSFVAFSLVSWLALYALQRLQGLLPLNSTDMPACPPTSRSTRR